MPKQSLDEGFHEVAAHFQAIGEAAKNAVASLDWIAILKFLENGGSFEEAASYFTEHSINELLPLIEDFQRQSELLALDQIAQFAVNEELG